MGTGICGAIFLEFAVETSRKDKFTERSAKGFFDYYELIPQSKRPNYEVYVIKDDLLISNYADFLIEFNTLIYDKFDGIPAPFDKVPVEENTKKMLSCKTRKEFDEAFEENKSRNASVPYIDTMSISCLSCDKNIPFLFYSGSYKAMLEEYSTLLHMEKMLVKAMNNKLKTIAKFGIFG